MSSSSLIVRVADAGSGIVIALAGAIDEHVEARDIVPRVAPHMVFDLDGISRITSYGVIHWLSAMKMLDGKEYAFVRCRPSMVRQFNMIKGFGRQGKLLTMYLPFFCASCKDEYEQLLDLTLNAQPVKTRTAPLSYCPKCATAGEFDDAAETYFDFGTDGQEQKYSIALRKLLGTIGPQLIAMPKDNDEESDDLRALRDGLTASTNRLAKLRAGRDS